MTLAEMRKEYARHGLLEAEAGDDPLALFRHWFDQALAAGLAEPNAVTLATASPEGRPASRVVLLKHLDERGFVFFTNYESRKGRELTANPAAALTFFWAELERQVRVEGRAERTTDAESDGYFQSRPRGSRLGAWASRQSEVIASREPLDRELQRLEALYEGRDVPRPPHWGGFRVVPELVEFWQGRPNRLHDRLAYRRQPDGSWRRERLSP
jgi:pyridoxamine 5'-phosphate oxidase